MRQAVFLSLLVFAIFALGYSTAGATQWTTGFNFKNQTVMKDEGWTLSNPDGITFTNPGIILGPSTAVAVYSVPEGIFDWKVDSGGYWLGSGHSWIDVQVNTERHTYQWVADGSRSKYVFYRDGAEALSFDGYHESVNRVIDLTMHKIGNTIALYSISQLMKNYVETDTQLSRITGVVISGPPTGAVKYVFAGGYVPEPNSSTQGQDALEANLNQVYPDGNIPEPSPPNTEGVAEAVSSTVFPLFVIVQNPSTYTYGTEEQETNWGGNLIVNNVGQQPGVAVFENVETNLYLQGEHYLYETGKTSPETYAGNTPYAGWPVSYYVTVDMHVSGSKDNPQSVGLVTVTISNGEGNVVYSTQISGVIPDQGSGANLYNQGSQAANDYLQGVLNSRK